MSQSISISNTNSLLCLVVFYWAIGERDFSLRKALWAGLHNVHLRLADSGHKNDGLDVYDEEGSILEFIPGEQRLLLKDGDLILEFKKI